MKKYEKPELEIELFYLENIMNGSSPSAPPSDDDEGPELPEI